MSFRKQEFLASPVIVFAFVVAAFFTVATVSVLREWGEYDSNIARVQTMSENVAHAVLQHFEDSIDLVDASLSSLISEIEVKDADPVHIQRLNRLMKAQVRFIPRLRGLFVYDALGNWIASSEPTPVGANHNW